MADAIRGDGLFRAERALAALVEDPQRLDRARSRFGDSPPSYTSQQSHSSTRSQSPNPPNEEQRRREERKWQQIRERQASLPREQFAAQRREEKERIYEAIGDGTLRVRAGTNVYQLAWENVKNRWVEQGIWNDEWDAMAEGLWKHEEPLELDSEIQTDTEAEPQRRPFSFAKMEQHPKPRRPRSDVVKQQIAERRAIREREREASRPFHQFIYQVSKERDRIQGKSGSGKAHTTTSADINTSAYENVKNTWTRLGIWNEKWGILPGMSWKHEETLEEANADGPTAVQANPLDSDGHEAKDSLIVTVNGAPLRNIFVQPVTDTSETGTSMRNNCTESNHRPVSTAAKLANGDTEISPSESKSPSFRRGRRDLPPTAGHTVRSGRRKPSYREGQTQPVASTYLRSVHSSKVSKAPIKRRPGLQQQPNATEMLSFDDPLLLPGPDIAEPPLQAATTPRRRSKRLQTKELGTCNEPAGTTSADPPHDVSQSRPKRIVGGNTKPVGTAKPQGISKKRHSRRSREGGRKVRT